MKYVIYYMNIVEVFLVGDRDFLARMYAWREERNSTTHQWEKCLFHNLYGRKNALVSFGEGNIIWEEIFYMVRDNWTYFFIF